MGKTATIDSFYKRKNVENSNVDTSLPTSNAETSTIEKRLKQFSRHENKKSNNDFERDPGLRQQIWEYPIDQRDEVRRSYINAGPYQYILSEYPKSGSVSHTRRFQSSWFQIYPSWLEYSPIKDAAFCLPCFLFNKPGANSGQNAFTIDGFQNWKKVRNGKDCAFMNHVGKVPNSSHKLAERACEDLMKQTQHIDLMLENHTSQEIENNRLRLKTSIEVIRLLAFQGCALRGHDESKDSINRGNFIEFLKLIASYNVLDKAPQNASYTSPRIQKEILHIIAKKVRKEICKEIDDARICIIVDESRDQSKREQMAIVLRFVDKAGFVQERFFGLVHVSDTKALTLKNAIFSTLSHNSLKIQNIRGQGYDGTSNMRGEWNGLQALVIADCPYAYYIHCFAHRLQLVLVATSRCIDPIENFFSKLGFIINVVSASCKRNDELKAVYADEVAYLISIDELETGTGLNQIGTLQRAGDTRWGSHLKSISSLIKMFSAACVVLNTVIDKGCTSSQRVEAESAYETLTSFEFVFILHLMQENYGDHRCTLSSFAMKV